jgi:hypothetical protein
MPSEDDEEDGALMRRGETVRNVQSGSVGGSARRL